MGRTPREPRLDVRHRIGLADAKTEAALSKWAPLGIRHAERALARLPGYPAALELRGFLRLLQWQYSPKAEPRLVQAAERDLRAATVPENPSRARAMSTLAYLLWRKGSFAEANRRPGSSTRLTSSSRTPQWSCIACMSHPFYFAAAPRRQTGAPRDISASRINGCSPCAG